MARALVRISYAAVAFVVGTLLVAVLLGVGQMLTHTSGDFGTIGRSLILVGGLVAAVAVFRVSGRLLQARRPSPEATAVRAAVRRLVLLIAAVPELGAFSYGDWARYVALVALVLVAVPFAAARRSTFQDLARATGILLVVMGVVYLGAAGLGIFPFVSGVVTLLAAPIRGARTRSGTPTATTA